MKLADIPEEVIEYKIPDNVIPNKYIEIMANKGMCVYWLVNSLRNISMNTDNNKASWSQAFGNMTGCQSNSH